MSRRAGARSACGERPDVLLPVDVFRRDARRRVQYPRCAAAVHRHLRVPDRPGARVCRAAITRISWRTTRALGPVRRQRRSPATRPCGTLGDGAGAARCQSRGRASRFSDPSGNVDVGANRRAPFNALAALAVVGLILTSGARSDRGDVILSGRSFFRSRACWKPTTTPTASCSMGRPCTGGRIYRRIPGVPANVAPRRARAGGRRLRTVRPAFRGRRDCRARQRRAACYAEAGSRWTFFEIDPLIERIAGTRGSSRSSRTLVPIGIAMSVTDASCWKLRHLILSTPSSWTPSAPTRFRSIC